jgi:radical SAM-linked protein
MPEQRLRVAFCKGERVRYISHLDVLRYWERAIRRAGMPLTYSQGFTPHPRITFAGPLPLGFLADREPMDVMLDERVAPGAFAEAVGAQTVPDLAIVGITEVAVGEAALQAALRWADYTCVIDAEAPADLQRAIERFLAVDRLDVLDERREKPRTIDLRAGVAWLLAEPHGEGGARLSMRLRANQEMTVRPETVLQALFPEYTASRITRTGVLLEERSPAREAWMRRGRFLP